MAKKMKRQKTTAADLPDEILHREILTRLPIKSVVRFKSVSKPWLSLFSNPQFVKQHHTHHSTLNPNDYDNLIADKGTRLVILSRYQETKLLPFDIKYFLIGSVNGLVCLRNNIKILLWNPAIHQFKDVIIPEPPSGVYKENMGLGFDSVSNDFKVVALSADLSYATVYCSGLDSWSVVFIPDGVFPKTKSGFEESTPTVIVKNCPYWTYSRITFDRQKYRCYLVAASFCVVKFNAETNEFKASPEFHFDVNAYGGEGYGFCHQFVDMKDRLSLIVYDKNCTSCLVEIYSLDGEEVGSGVWSKMYSIGPLDFYLHGLGWYASLSQGFKYGGEIVYHDYGRFSCIGLPCIDHVIDTTKDLRGTTSTDYKISCFRYAPTLFFIQGMMSVNLTTQTRTLGCYRAPRRLISSLRG